MTCNAPCCLLLSAVYITISYRQYRHVPPPRNDDDRESIAAASGAGGGVGDGGGGGPAVPPWSSGSFPPSKIRKIYDTYVQQGASGGGSSSNGSKSVNKRNSAPQMRVAASNACGRLKCVWPPQTDFSHDLRAFLIGLLGWLAAVRLRRA
jgi:hypothetical protein